MHKTIFGNPTNALGSAAQIVKLRNTAGSSESGVFEPQISDSMDLAAGADERPSLANKN